MHRQIDGREKPSGFQGLCHVLTVKRQHVIKFDIDFISEEKHPEESEGGGGKGSSSTGGEEKVFHKCFRPLEQ